MTDLANYLETTDKVVATVVDAVKVVIIQLCHTMPNEGMCRDVTYHVPSLKQTRAHSSQPSVRP